MATNKKHVASRSVDQRLIRKGFEPSTVRHLLDTIARSDARLFAALVGEVLAKHA